MQIAIASSGLGHICRGVEAWAADLGLALNRRGRSVLLFKGGGTADTSYERTISCWKREESRTLRLREWLPRRATWRLGVGNSYDIEQTTFALTLLAHLRKESVDILHVQDPQIALIVQRARQLGWVKARSILGHGTNEPLDFLRKITYLQHLAPHHLQVARDSGAWRPTWTSIPNFIDTDLFRPGRSDELRTGLGIPGDGIVVMTAAAVKQAHKRIDYLLEEFAHLLRMEPELPVWLVVAGGRESDTDLLVKRGRDMLGDRVRFLVSFPRERMPDLYRLADVFVLCSLREMMPIALLEATASGLPCLVNRHPVTEWVVSPGGESLDMAAQGALSIALRRLLNDPARRRHLGERARAYCLAQFSQDRVVDQLLTYYDFVHTHGRSTARQDFVANHDLSELGTVGVESGGPH